MTDTVESTIKVRRDGKWVEVRPKEAVKAKEDWDGNVITDTYATKEEVEEDLRDMFKVMGSCTNRELETKERVIGHVWNILDYKEGEEKKEGDFPVGTNVMCDKDLEWDDLSATLTGYATRDYVKENFVSKAGDKMTGSLKLEAPEGEDPAYFIGDLQGTADAAVSYRVDDTEGTTASIAETFDAVNGRFSDYVPIKSEDAVVLQCTLEMDGNKHCFIGYLDGTAKSATAAENYYTGEEEKTTSIASAFAAVDEKLKGYLPLASDDQVILNTSVKMGIDELGVQYPLVGDLTGNADTSDTAATARAVEFIRGTGTKAGVWTGVSTLITSAEDLVDGVTIAYYVNVKGSSETTLNINKLGALPVMRNDERLKTHLPVGTVVLLTYSTASGTPCWHWADSGGDVEISSDIVFNDDYCICRDVDTGYVRILGGDIDDLTGGKIIVSGSGRTLEGEAYAQGWVELVARKDTAVTTFSVKPGAAAVLDQDLVISKKKGSVTATSFIGNATSATKLATARKLSVSLGNTESAQTFDGTADAASIPVSGILSEANGGTGLSDLTKVTVGKATQLAASHLFSVSLDKNATGDEQWFDGTADATEVPVHGVLPVANGGTGAESLDSVTVGKAKAIYLTSAVGSSSIPVYFQKNGVPKAITVASELSEVQDNLLTPVSVLRPEFARYMPLAGGVFTGAVEFAKGKTVIVPDDALCVRSNYEKEYTEPLDSGFTDMNNIMFTDYKNNTYCAVLAYREGNDEGTVDNELHLQVRNDKGEWMDTALKVIHNGSTEKVVTPELDVAGAADFRAAVHLRAEEDKQIKEGADSTNPLYVYFPYNNGDHPAFANTTYLHPTDGKVVAITGPHTSKAHNGYRVLVRKKSDDSEFSSTIELYDNELDVEAENVNVNGTLWVNSSRWLNLRSDNDRSETAGTWVSGMGVVDKNGNDIAKIHGTLGKDTTENAMEINAWKKDGSSGNSFMFWSNGWMDVPGGININGKSVPTASSMFRLKWSGSVTVATGGGHVTIPSDMMTALNSGNNIICIGVNQGGIVQWTTVPFQWNWSLFIDNVNVHDWNESSGTPWDEGYKLYFSSDGYMYANLKHHRHSSDGSTGWEGTNNECLKHFRIYGTD